MSDCSDKLPEIPKYLKDCPVFFNWCNYKGKVYFGALNFSESEKIKQPVIDLHYCETAALNNNLIELTVIYNKEDFI